MVGQRVHGGAMLSRSGRLCLGGSAWVVLPFPLRACATVLEGVGCSVRTVETPLRPPRRSASGVVVRFSV